jgi:hypothetical protein
MRNKEFTKENQAKKLGISRMTLWRWERDGVNKDASSKTNSGPKNVNRFPWVCPTCDRETIGSCWVVAACSCGSLMEPLILERRAMVRGLDLYPGEHVWARLANAILMEIAEDKRARANKKIVEGA